MYYWESNTINNVQAFKKCKIKQKTETEMNEYLRIKCNVLMGCKNNKSEREGGRLIQTKNKDLCQMMGEAIKLRLCAIFVFV